MPWLAGTMLRLVSKLELEVLSSCLLRWSGEVKEEIASLQVNLRDSVARIKDMDKKVSLQQRGYCLHTMMVQKGHYRA